MHDNDISSEFGFFNYSIYRCDRNHSNNNCLRDGGVLIAIVNNYVSTVLNTNNNELESCFVFVKINKYTQIIIGSVYFLPNSPISSSFLHSKILYF